VKLEVSLTLPWYPGASWNSHNDCTESGRTLSCELVSPPFQYTPYPTTAEVGGGSVQVPATLDLMGDEGIPGTPEEVVIKDDPVWTAAADARSSTQPEYASEPSSTRGCRQFDGSKRVRYHCGPTSPGSAYTDANRTRKHYNVSMNNYYLPTRIYVLTNTNKKRHKVDRYGLAYKTFSSTRAMAFCKNISADHNYPAKCDYVYD
jgi:hypothetical protein